MAIRRGLTSTFAYVILVFLGLFFLVAWTNFFVPLIILQSQNLLPASVHIYTFFGSYGQVNYGQLAAYALLYALPAVVLYTVVSRFFVRGVSGGLKG